MQCVFSEITQGFNFRHEDRMQLSGFYTDSGHVLTLCYAKQY